MMDLVWFLVFWVKQHPYPVGATVAASLIIGWLLNRKSVLTKDSDRIINNLIETSRDKYKDTRPLR